jgi:hypothetical protein
MVLGFIDKLGNGFDSNLSKLSAFKTLKILTVAVLLSITYNIAFSFVLEYFTESGLKADELESIPPFKLLLMATILAPLVETFVFQFLLIEIICFFSKSKMLALVVSTILFALTHAYNLNYILFAFIPGFMLGILYLILKNKQKPAFILVCLAHALSNLYSFIHNNVFN